MKIIAKPLATEQNVDNYKDPLHFPKQIMKFFIIVSLLISYASARKPNIILIYMDDMGYSDIGCFGSTKNRTPVLDLSLIHI